MGADGPTHADDLMFFMTDELGIPTVFEALGRPKEHVDAKTGKNIAHREAFARTTLNFTSLIGRLLGLPGLPDYKAVLLCDPRWMAFFGFNAMEVEEGANSKSTSLIGMTRTGSRGKFTPADSAGPVRTRPEGPRGAFSPQTLADHECALPPEELVSTLNNVIRQLALKGYFDSNVSAVLDATDEEVPPSFSDAGVVKKKAKVKTKASRPQQLQTYIRGFKIWFLMDVKTALPLAFYFDTIERPDNEHAKQVVLQAIENLKGAASIRSLALDRGFMDGDLLWWLKSEQHIDWVCPAKEQMTVTDEARIRVAQALEQASSLLKSTSELTPQQDLLELPRLLAQTHKEVNGVRFEERKINNMRDTLVIAEVKDLFNTDFYGVGGANSSRLNSKKYQPTPLHATVVLNWPDTLKEDSGTPKATEQNRKQLVILSPIPEGALKRYDRYDQRSLIENQLNRTLKQCFSLGTSLARNANAMLAASVFSTLAIIVERAFRIHLDRAYETLDKRGELLGVLRYRRQVYVLNRNKVIIVVDGYYSILPLAEFARVAGFSVKDEPSSRERSRSPT